MDMLSADQLGDRVLVVLYRLSQGMPGIQIQRKTLLDECNRLKIKQMTTEEFETFRTESVRQFSKQSNN